MFLLISLCVLIPSIFSLSDVNDRPIIGILAEEKDFVVQPIHNKTHILASYVKFLEFSGARVVPIMVYQSEKYYQDLMGKLNGVLFPGGGNLLNGTGYSRTGTYIIDIAKKMNDKGDFFPLWGTCLGFELLNYAIRKDAIEDCAAENLPLNINFVQGFEKSRIFEKLHSSLQKIMQSQNITIHNHQRCYSPKNYKKSGLDQHFKVLATNKDSKGVTFISVIEGIKYPFYGVAFHPEKVLFEWVMSKTLNHIPHSAEAVEVSQYFSRFFVNEARKSSNHFPSEIEEDKVLIYNYNPVFTGDKKDYFTVQTYFFKPKET